ncbi:glycosyltransferase family 4 protein [uncultured Kocuria sp.]|uniref:glycosyltransferase family 4 protein n=1 Tax=uncultured Kocuria sp. TaxID=259305 RepID=UPI0025956374|nr:glycosyltransferase family 4 protein [uncultured Kocuria sp.]MCT1366519.1 glycosyltransferase family 4 protein [Rothia sp. p3-SID1597]
MKTSRASAKGTRRIYIATNNGDISGGENMMFSIAHALRDSGREATIVGPSSPGDTVARARAEGFDVVELAASSRRDYLLKLALFGLRHRRDWVWCNGLVPSFAMSLHPRRIVHLHQIPVGFHRLLARVASFGARARLVPSHFAAQEVTGFQAFPNWVPRVEATPRSAGPTADPTLRIGFMGRISTLKGVVTLAAAVRRVQENGLAVELHLSGGSAHVSDEESRRVEQALDDLPEGTVVRHGFIAPRDFYPTIDVLCVPSEWGEVFGLVAAEAMSARMPLVVSDDGGLPDVVGTHHEWVYPAGDSEALARTLENLHHVMTEDPLRLSQATRMSYERWAERLSPGAGAVRTRELADRLHLPFTSRAERNRP